MMDKLRCFWRWLHTAIYPSHPVYPVWLVLDMILFWVGFMTLLCALGVLFK